MVLKFWIILLKTDYSILLLKTNKKLVCLYCFLGSILLIQTLLDE